MDKFSSFDLRSTTLKIARKFPFKTSYFSLLKRKATTVKPSAGPSTKPTPKFCGEHDCPYFYEKKFNISDKNVTDYTLRCYPKPYKWVSTTVQGNLFISF